MLVLIFYTVVSKEAPGQVKQKKLSDYWTLRTVSIDGARGLIWTENLK
jgi:hypothetical protein